MVAPEHHHEAPNHHCLLSIIVIMNIMIMTVMIMMMMIMVMMMMTRMMVGHLRRILLVSCRGGAGGGFVLDKPDKKYIEEHICVG